MEAPVELKGLAEILKRRRQASARPYTLLLTSALSLTPAMLSILCGVDDWNQFRSSIQQKSRNDRRLALNPLLHSTAYQSGYTAIAHLIAAGYFSTILTTNIDSVLEDTLRATGENALVPQMLVLHRDPEEHIRQMLSDSTQALKIIKLHGNLRDGIIPDRFPDFSEFSFGLRKSLRDYLNQDLIIVGSLEHDHDVRRILSWEGEGSLYYISRRELSEEEIIYRLIRERGGNPVQRMFTGPLGDANLFFTTLEQLLLPALSLPEPVVEPHELVETDGSVLKFGSHGEKNNMPDFTNGYALIIGIAHYPKVRRLPEIVLQDARDLRNLLQSAAHCGYRSGNVRLLLDDQASADGIRTGLCWLADVADSGATAFVFFSGHGGRVENSQMVNHYLIPYDCEPVNLSETAISGDELTGLLRNIKAQRLVACFDSCYAGGTGETKEFDPAHPEFKLGLKESYYTQLAQGAGRVIMASSRANEVSLVLQNMSNSLFTHYLLEALRGQAPTHNDGLIRVFDVFHYIAENVPKRGSQHPIFKATDVENNFPVALYLGGKEVRSATNHSMSAQPQRLAVDRRALRKQLVQKFTLEDLQVLCADIEQNLENNGIKLQVNLDLIGGSSQEARALNLIRYLDNREYLDYLIRAVEQWAYPD